MARTTAAESLESLASTLVRFEARGEAITTDKIIDAVSRCRELLNREVYFASEGDRLQAAHNLCIKLIPGA